MHTTITLGEPFYGCALIGLYGDFVSENVRRAPTTT
jgi:hypothetical protein